MKDISPKAIVCNPAGLAADVRVGPFSFVGPDVTIGPGTVLENNVTVTGNVSIGPNCRLMPGCVVGCTPAVGQAAPGKVTIGQNNAIREHVIIEGGSTPAGTVLGDNNLLMVGCQIGSDARLDGNDIFANFTRIESGAHVEKFVQTSGFATVGANATVGAYTFTTGYTGIDRDAPPFAIVHGFPFRVRGVNTEKLHRCGFDQATIELLKDVFRRLFNGQGSSPSPENIREMEALPPNEHLRYLLASLGRSAASPAGRQAESAGREK